MINNLPQVRGTYENDFPLAGFTNFKTGGRAEVLYTPAGSEDLAEFLKNKPANVPVTVLGLGSNILIADGGVAGVVIRLGGAFSEAKFITPNIIKVGAFATDAQISQVALKNDLSGFEFLASIPGTIGGGIKTNAGCYGSSIASILVNLTLCDTSGNITTISNAECEFSYRASKFAADNRYIFLSCELAGTPSTHDEVAAIMQEMKSKRVAEQPLGARTFGSTFKNPEGHSAWKLISEADANMLKVGGAYVSEKHANFIVNDGSASTQDALTLISQIVEKVKKHSGIELVPEVQIIK